jgi:hypothetical protein
MMKRKADLLELKAGLLNLKPLAFPLKALELQPEMALVE